MSARKDNAPFLRMVATFSGIAFRGMPVAMWINVIMSFAHSTSWALLLPAQQVLFDAVADAVTARATLVVTLLPLAVFLGANLLTQIFNGVANFLAGMMFEKSAGVFSHIIHQKAARVDPICFEDPAHLDDINKAREGIANVMQFLFLVLLGFAFYGLFFAIVGAYLYTLKPMLVWSLLIIFIPMALMQAIRSATFSKLEDMAAPARRKMEYYEKCVSDREFFKETRLLGGVKYFTGLYKDSLLLLNRKTWQAESRTTLIELGMRALTMVGYVIILIMLVSALIAGEITVGAFAAVFGSLGMLFSIMEEVVCRHVGEMSKNFGKLKNLYRFLNLPERVGSGRQSQGPLRDTVDHLAAHGVSLKAASFRYPGAERDALERVSLDILPGETIAIVGENGSGKSTLVRLLCGLYLPTEGDVQIGGASTRALSPAMAFASLSGVFQKFQRYKMTLGENIELSGREAQGDGKSQVASGGRSALQDAAHKADLDIASDSFPEGFDTMLAREFDGVDLSGGQWQRVAIARGFYRAHGVIVLDEPTAAIDPIEETRVYESFAQMSSGKTAIIVTHRLGSARIADRIAVMDKGRLIDIGTHDQLMERGGVYADMYAAQAKWYVKD